MKNKVSFKIPELGSLDKALLKLAVSFLLVVCLLAITIAANAQNYIDVWQRNPQRAVAQLVPEALPSSFESTLPSGQAVIYEQIASPTIIVKTSGGKRSKFEPKNFRSTSDFSVVSFTPSGWTGIVQDGKKKYQLTAEGVVQDTSKGTKMQPVDEVLTPAPKKRKSKTANRQAQQAPPNFWNPNLKINKTSTFYLEAGYDLYQRFGSVNNVVANISSSFGAVKELYWRDGINITLNEVYVWTSLDPYASITSAATILNTFGTNRSSVKWKFRGFLNDKNYGGIGYISRGAVTDASYFYCGIGKNNGSSSSTVYSWFVYVVAHEAGHNHGLSHTHNGCAWIDSTGKNVGRLDMCYACESYCTPVAANCTGTTTGQKGTIMSYCHLYYGNLDFNLGFGKIPAKVLREAMWNSSIPFDVTGPPQPPPAAISKWLKPNGSSASGVIKSGSVGLVFDSVSNTNESRLVSTGVLSVTATLASKQVDSIRLWNGYLNAGKWGDPITSFRILINGVEAVSVTGNTKVDRSFFIGRTGVNTITLECRDAVNNRIRELGILGK
jgi:Metallo-peptidase family M12